MEKHVGRNILIVFMVLLMTSFAFAKAVQKSDIQIGQLKVIIVGLKNDEGKVKIGLFDSKESYSNGGEPFRGCSVAILDKKAECTFKNIPYGTYAIKVYQDKNVNGELDTNSIGIPKEPYGFSNNTRGRFGPAKWDDAQFFFTAESMSIEITLE
jgi:uncharacterized protein (DUF2141 family)